MLNNFFEVVVQTRGVFRSSEIASRLRNLEIAAENNYAVGLFNRN